MLKKKGFKRSLAVLMLAASPFAYTDPISPFQEALPSVTPKLVFHILQDPEPLPEVKPVQVKKIKKPGQAVYGIASWYSQTDPFINKHTANGEVFNDQAMTCASWNHPFGTRLKVTNTANGKSVICRVNDRGPNKRLGRVIDLSLGSFRRIAPPSRGLIKVSISKISA